jgi:hypothetical protein
VAVFSFFGCDFLPTEVPPEQLPPIPAECSDESQRLSKALFGAYTSAEVSQMQITRVTNALVESLRIEELTRAEAKGIIKKKKKEIQEQVEKGEGSQKIYVF